MKKTVGVHPDVIERMFSDEKLGVLFSHHTFGIASSLPYCDAPVPLLLQAKRKRRDLSDVGPGRVFDLAKGGGSLGLSFFAPCRKCEKCLFIKSMRLKRKIMDELQLACNNHWNAYFVTLTFRSGKRMELWHAATRLAGSSAPSRKQRARPVVAEVAEFLRRLRQRSKRIGDGHLRYCSVVEYHASGDPHVHLVLTGTITSKTIRRAKWQGGYVHIRRIPYEAERAGDIAGYVAKYISKTADAVVTHSQRYGTWLNYRPNGSKGPMVASDESPLENATAVSSDGKGPSRCEVNGVASETRPNIPSPKKDAPYDNLLTDFWMDKHLLRIMHKRSYDLECPKTPVQLALALHQEPGAQSPTSWPRPANSKVPPETRKRRQGVKKAAFEVGTEKATGHSRVWSSDQTTKGVREADAVASNTSIALAHAQVDAEAVASDDPHVDRVIDEA